MSKPAWGKWGTWEETESYLGKVIGVTEGAEAVEPGTIRRWMESKEFHCPIHFDDAAARAAGYKKVIAPDNMIFTYGLPAYWQSGDPHEQPGAEPRQIPIPVIFDVPAPCNLSFASNIDVEYLAPMHLGDRITRTSRLAGISRKTLRVGDGAFLRQEDTYTNQHDEVVAIVTLDIFRFVAPDDKED
ncbi:MAG: MaoC family dehydratase N-terminal domain-containing protein [Gammaproteobacteria bacterium]|nr:MaoC family dehydratase N-terminal domain-containing protein [Gammaproteobacteria bacterium]MDE0283067.1 MaoC family dehydratase N-terminal domain-containing protein [Gammaproteobacteria bacterium]MDE0512307.1 MaoC family dehydratase N-terminal domain-containing protein [Gammaproteobacteria bacterium]